MTIDPHEIAADRLRRRVDPTTLPFQTTAEVTPLEGTVGQPRALDAVAFGLAIEAPGYNLFVVGAPGSGRATAVRDHLERFAREQPVPADWVYVHNFTDPDRPTAISVAAGEGRRLAQQMDELVEAARRAIVRAFESEEYQKRRGEVVADIEAREQELRREVEGFAAQRGFGLQITPVGLAVFPTAEGHPLTPEEVERLPAERRTELEERSREIYAELQSEVRQLRQLEREGSDRLHSLERSLALAAIDPLFNMLRDRYATSPEVFAYLNAVEEDIPAHLAELRASAHEGDEAELALRLQGVQRDDILARYRVNVVVDNSALGSAPVVIEHNPTYYNLMGRIDYRARYGAIVTDLGQVRAGSLHRANGGYLVLDALEVLRNPFTWDALKRALRSREVTIENLAEQFSPIPTATLHPHPIPLDVKVVMVGPPLLYLLLFAHDQDLRELFKVKVEFAPEMDWDDGNALSYAAFIARCVTQAGLLPLDRTAVARVIEYGGRLRENQRKLSTRLLEISDLVTESSFWAQSAGHPVVIAEDVDTAVARKEYRSDLLEERLHELIREGTILIETDGARVGQVNGLSVVDLGDHSFGQPSRITARVSLGRGTVESIERETDMSGPIHSKGFLILSGYLAQQYAQEWPLALRGSITFEQAYDEVEGDSASSAELYALLSALSGLPLRQGVAVTGSINQHGEIQAVGGVTRKVEGFFEVCRARGLTGEQGVIIPVANLPNLMLDDEVVEACRNGTFHVWAVSRIDEGLELLTGRAAGDRHDGVFAPGSVHRLVEDRLREYAERLQPFAGSANGHNRPRLVSPAHEPLPGVPRTTG